MKFSEYSKSTKAAIVATIYLLLYATLYFAEASAHILFMMLLIAPIVVIVLVYMVISDRSGKMRDLKRDEEFSYQDWEGASEEKEKPN